MLWRPLWDGALTGGAALHPQSWLTFTAPQRLFALIAFVITHKPLNALSVSPLTARAAVSMLTHACIC